MNQMNYLPTQLTKNKIKGISKLIKFVGPTKFKLRPENLKICVSSFANITKDYRVSIGRIINFCAYHISFIDVSK